MSDLTAEQLLEKAKAASEQSYSPYSHFPVGAALLAANGNVFTGCNVENVSYGLTICAEQVAIAKAVSEGQQKFKAIAVWAKDRPNGAITPCGACRQVLAEFLPAEAPVYYFDETGNNTQTTLKALLPEAFSEL